MCFELKNQNTSKNQYLFKLKRLTKRVISIKMAPILILLPLKTILLLSSLIFFIILMQSNCIFEVIDFLNDKHLNGFFS